jgi:hypothetical protein
VVHTLDPGVPGSPGPRGFLHVHRLSWESSDGNPASLHDVETRESVRFRTSTQIAPFNAMQDPDQVFVQGGNNFGLLSNDDDHSTCLPAIICAHPRVPGTLIGEQWYQYRRRGEPDWTNIEGAAFLLEKSVFQEGPDWVFSFKKTNWAPHNTVPFHFEVHYTIGAPPVPMPDAYEAIATNTACVKEVAAIEAWARRVVSRG